MWISLTVENIALAYCYPLGSLQYSNSIKKQVRRPRSVQWWCWSIVYSLMFDLSNFCTHNSYSIVANVIQMWSTTLFVYRIGSRYRMGVGDEGAVGHMPPIWSGWGGTQLGISAPTFFEGCVNKFWRPPLSVLHRPPSPLDRPPPPLFALPSDEKNFLTCNETKLCPPIVEDLPTPLRYRAD